VSQSYHHIWSFTLFDISARRVYFLFVVSCIVYVSSMIFTVTDKVRLQSADGVYGSPCSPGGLTFDYTAHIMVNISIFFRISLLLACFVLLDQNYFMGVGRPHYQTSYTTTRCYKIPCLYYFSNRFSRRFLNTCHLNN